MTKYNGKGLPNENDILTLNIPLKKQVSVYKSKKDGTERSFEYYAQIGSQFGGEPIGDGTLLVKVTVWQAKKAVTPSTKFTIG